ncbi:MAG TPA: glycosyltransferase family 4 protein [Terriglobales bacterium]|nr:glycosyltransferase family 4 protein [Terriglobales bacterium]
MATPLRILILNQAFHPDVVSTAQHATDLAVALAESGHQVTVVASARGYDDPARHFPGRERWRGIDIVRVRGTGLGKVARWRRAVDFASFMATCALRLLWLPRFDVVVAMTSPPLISVLAALAVPWKARRFLFWSMDLNPDEAIAAGWLRSGSLVARVLTWLLRYSLRRADCIVALDRFMKQRIESHGVASEKIEVVPPWSHDDAVRFDEGGRAQFRAEHGLEGKFVVMYSGNHSPCHPLRTLLAAAERLWERPEIMFCFVGGGSEFQRVEAYARERKLGNVLCLPYQPRGRLAASLSSADLHAVVMGNAFTGLVHPCKIYNILAVGAPILYIGPRESHVTDIVARLNGNGNVYAARHGDVTGVAEQIVGAARRNGSGRHVELAGEFSQRTLIPQMIRALQAIATEVPDSISQGRY